MYTKFPSHLNRGMEVASTQKPYKLDNRGCSAGRDIPLRETTYKHAYFALSERIRDLAGQPLYDKTHITRMFEVEWITKAIGTTAIGSDANEVYPVSRGSSTL